MAFYGKFFFWHIWRPIDGSQLVLLHVPPFNCHLAPGVHNEGREGEGGRSAKYISTQLKISMLHTLKAVEHKPHGMMCIHDGEDKARCGCL